MIVICTRCQARFRVADDKIGPRGAKVRCSKCQTVFAVHRDLGSLPAEDPPRPAPRPPAAAVDLEPQRPAARAPPPVPGPVAPPPPVRVAPDDPFAPDPFRPAAASDDPFAEADRAGALGASAAPLPDPPPVPNPFGAEGAFSSPPPAGEPLDAADPFASPAASLAQAADPFAAAVTPRSAGGGSALPVTDLSDLLGEPTPAAIRGPRAAPPPIPPPAREVGPARGAEDAEDGIGLSLEERLTPAPAPPGPGFSEPEAPPPPYGFEPGAFGGASDPGAFEPSALEAGPADELSLALATEPPVAAPPPPAPSPSPPARAPARAAAPPPAAPEEEPAPDRIPGGRGARVRSLAVNAAALAALLLVAFALLAVWRSGGRLELAALRPAAVLAGLRGGSEPFAAEGVTSGLYERDAAPPLLFVRGRAVSRGQGPVPGLRVRVEIVRAGEVVARGETVAGAVPGAEELHAARDGAAVAAVARAVEARAPREVRPGEALPFLVAISDHPADLAGASLRVSVEAAGRP